MRNAQFALISFCHHRILQDDLIEVFKLLKRLEDTDHRPTTLFTLSQLGLLGHPYLYKPYFKLDIRMFFFLFGLLAT